MFPVAARRERAAADAADRGVEHRRAGLERRVRRSRSPCCACCAGGRRPARRASTARPTSSRTWRGTPTPTVSAKHDLVRAGGDEPRRELRARGPGRRRPRTGSRRRRRSSPSRGCRPRARARRSARRASTTSSTEAFALRRLNVLGRGEGEVRPRRAPSRAAGRSPRSLSDEPRVHDALAPLDRRDDLLRARHLRHARRVDEADRLDPRHARRRQPVDELGAHLRARA